MHLVNATINSAYLLARTAALGASLLLSSEAAAADIALTMEGSCSRPACFSSGAGSEARP
jgi:hypothetical protein